MHYALAARLAAAKSKAAANAETRARQLVTYPGASDTYLNQWPVDWRVVARANAKRRYDKRSPWNPVCVADNGDRMRWLERVDGSGLRVAVENATEKANRNTIGYYVDTFQEETQHGVVLATRDPESPRARFFAAISDPHNAGAYRILWESHDDMDSAVRAADSMAENDAERQRDYDSAWQAGARFADLGEEIATARAEALAILQDRKSATGSPALCAVIREKVDSLVAAIAEARAARARLANGDGESDGDYYRAFWPGGKRLQAAFCEGAGLAAFPA